MNLNITQTESGLLQIAGTLDIYSADAFREELVRHVQARPSVALDLSAVEACDITGLQLLCSAAKTAAADGKRFEIAAVSTALTETRTALGFTAEQLSGASHSNL